MGGVCLRKARVCARHWFLLVWLWRFVVLEGSGEVLRRWVEACEFRGRFLLSLVSCGSAIVVRVPRSGEGHGAPEMAAFLSSCRPGLWLLGTKKEVEEVHAQLES